MAAPPGPRWGDDVCLHNTHQYLKESPITDLQTLETWIPASSYNRYFFTESPPVPEPNKYWVMYVTNETQIEL